MKPWYWNPEPFLEYELRTDGMLIQRDNRRLNLETYFGRFYERWYAILFAHLHWHRGVFSNIRNWLYYMIWCPLVCRLRGHHRVMGPLGNCYCKRCMRRLVKSMYPSDFANGKAHFRACSEAEGS